MALQVVPFNAIEFLETEEAQIHLIEDALNSGDANYISHALDVVAKARGITRQELVDIIKENPAQWRG
jgi:DNA-binding phage protein